MRDAVHDYLMQRPAGASAEELLDLIFTHRGSDSELGPRFLRSMLGADGRFAYRSQEGRWIATAHQRLACHLDQAELVVVDLETTGGAPRGGAEIIEIGAVRIAAGQVVDRFQQLVDPGCPLPPFITRLTGISADMLRAQPRIDRALRDFTAFAGEDVLVAHNASFDMGFLNAAACRVFGQPLSQPHLCTLRLARRLLPLLRRRSLDSLVGHLGIACVDRHRALGDATMTAEVFFHFIELLKRRGILRLDELLDFQHHASDGRRFFCALPRSAVAELPRAPGIYRFSAEDDQLLYIGKAKDLRQRVSSYLSNAGGHSRKTLELIRQIRSVAVSETGSELEASLLEAEEIRRCQPPFNRLRKHLPRVAFLKLNITDEYPRLSVVGRLGSARARFFGPFRSRPEAQRALEVLTRTFGLRTCSGRLRPDPDFPPCFQGQVGLCTVPCNGSVDSEGYRAQVDRMLRFFDGDGQALEDLAARREVLSAGQHFEAAGRLQREIDFAEKLRRRQHRLGWIVERQHFAVVQPTRDDDGVLVYIVAHGRMVERARIRTDSYLRALAARTAKHLDAEPARLSAEDVDGTTILAAWLRDRGERDGYVLPIRAGETEMPGRLPEWAAALRELAPSARQDGAQELIAAPAE